MAVIEVNHSKIKSSAEQVDSYITKHKEKMEKINSKVETLGESWTGKDYKRAKAAWKDIKGSNSTSGKMLKDLENYSELLKFSAEKYKKAQIDAIERANAIFL